GKRGAADEERGGGSKGRNYRGSRGCGGDCPDPGPRRGGDEIQPAETGRRGRAGRKVETILPGFAPGVDGKRSSWKSVITIWFLSCGRRRRKTRSRKSSRSSNTPARKRAARSRRPSTGARASSPIAWPSTAKVSTFTRKSAPRMVS